METLNFALLTVESKTVNNLDKTSFKLSYAVWCVRQDLIEEIPILYIIWRRHFHLWDFFDGWSIKSVKICNMLMNNFDA